MASVATSAWRTVAGIGRGGNRAIRVEATVGPVEPAPAVEPSAAEASHDVTAVLEAYRGGMSRAEARQRIVAALAARLFSEQQLQMVRDAQITAGGDTSQLDSAMVTLTERQLGESVRLMLEASPSLLSEQSLGDLRNILEAESAPRNGTIEAHP